MGEQLEWRSEEGKRGICWACNAERDLAFALYEGESNVLVGWLCDLHCKKGHREVEADLEKWADGAEARARELRDFARAIGTQMIWPPPVERDEPDLAISDEELTDHLQRLPPKKPDQSGRM